MPAPSLEWAHSLHRSPASWLKWFLNWSLILDGGGSVHLTAGMPHAHFVRGPTPGIFSGWTVVEKESATGSGLSAVPAARETLCDTPKSRFGETNLALLPRGPSAQPPNPLLSVSLAGPTFGEETRGISRAELVKLPLCFQACWTDLRRGDPWLACRKKRPIVRFAGD